MLAVWLCLLVWDVGKLSGLSPDFNKSTNLLILSLEYHRARDFFILFWLVNNYTQSIKQKHKYLMYLDWHISSILLKDINISFRYICIVFLLKLTRPIDRKKSWWSQSANSRGKKIYLWYPYVFLKTLLKDILEKKIQVRGLPNQPLQPSVWRLSELFSKKY